MLKEVIHKRFKFGTDTGDVKKYQHAYRLYYRFV